jgi:hypothetical protein
MARTGVELPTVRYRSRIAGVLSCYDRIIIQGTLPKWRYAQGMTDYSYERQIRIFDYPRWAEALRDAIRENSLFEASGSSARRSGSRKCRTSVGKSPGRCAFRRSTRTGTATWPEASSIICINLIASLSFRKPTRVLAFHRGGSSAKAMQDGL